MTYIGTNGDPLSPIQKHVISIEIGDAVIQLLQREKKVSVGGIIDYLEIKRRHAEDEKAELIREILIFIRKTSSL